MAQAKILVVEDDTAILELIVRFLQQNNYQVQSASNGKSALKLFEIFNPDLVILDINLPDILGYDLCEQMQGNTNVYVLMLSSRIHWGDKEKGFCKGADDYLTKPFDLQELEWRIRAILKRQRLIPIIPQSPKSFFDEGLIIDPNRREITINGQLVQFSYLEFELFSFLAFHYHKVWSRTELIEKIWKVSLTDDTRVVDVHIGQIRKKLQSLPLPCSSIRIKTVRGVGYQFKFLNNKK